MNTHKDTFMNLSELGTVILPYHPTFVFENEYIDSSHQFFATCPVDGILIQITSSSDGTGPFIQGWLRREDALKLYEMAYFSQQDILELGSHHGLSTTILSEANQRAAVQKKIFSVDLSLECVKHTAANLRSKGLGAGVTLVCAEATSAVQAFVAQGQKFGFVFIDHSHAYQAVYTVCQLLDKVVAQGGFCLFHDFNDARNAESGNEDYGVYQAVLAGLNADEFEFYGIYGCTGLFRKR